MSKWPERASPEPVIECEGVSKHFYVYEHRSTSLREWFIRTVLRDATPPPRAEFRLRDFNLTAWPGEVVGLIGANGSGKSTALRLIAGIYRPTAGTIRTVGRVASVIELGAGLHPELTGAENVRLYGAVLGLDRAEVARRLKEIVRFADIGEFIGTPVKYYSSGMAARLAFSVAIAAEPDILLLDEVLAVGDQDFRQRCIDRLEEYRAAGATLVLVSHDLDMVRRHCSRVLWLSAGRVVADGASDRVVQAYEDAWIARAGEQSGSEPRGPTPDVPALG